MEVASRKWHPERTSCILLKVTKSILHREDGYKSIVIWNNAASLFIRVRLKIANQPIIDDFNMKVSRRSSESRRDDERSLFYSPFQKR